MMNKLEEPLVSVIVLNYNGIKHLNQCYDSLNNMTYKNVELILIDNNSQDKSVELVRKKYPHVKIIQLDENLGFAKANNIAASQAKGKYIAFLNNDTYVDIKWLTELVNLARRSREIGIVASKIYYHFDKNLINYAGSSLDKYGKVSHIGENKRDHKVFNIERTTFYACGAAFLIKNEVIKKIGLFDPVYFMYAEDLDLSWRVWLLGYKVLFAPKSFIYHKIGQGMDKQSKKQKFLGERNLLRTLLKNYKTNTLIKTLPVYVGRRIGTIIKYFFQMDKSFFLYSYIYIKAILWNLFTIKSLIRNRKMIQSYRIKDDDFIFQLMANTTKFEKALSKI